MRHHPGEGNRLGGIRGPAEAEQVVLYNKLSSANMAHDDNETNDGRSLAYSTKRSGPRTDPCGTPEEMARQEEMECSTFKCTNGASMQVARHPP